MDKKHDHTHRGHEDGPPPLREAVARPATQKALEFERGEEKGR